MRECCACLSSWLGRCFSGFLISPRAWSTWRRRREEGGEGEGEEKERREERRERERRERKEGKEGTSGRESQAGRKGRPADTNDDAPRDGPRARKHSIPIKSQKSLSASPAGWPLTLTLTLTLALLWRQLRLVPALPARLHPMRNRNGRPSGGKERRRPGRVTVARCLAGAARPLLLSACARSLRSSFIIGAATRGETACSSAQLFRG